MCLCIAVIITELETVLEILRKEATPPRSTSSASLMTEEFAVSDLSRSPDVFPFQPEGISALSSPAHLSTSSALCQQWHSKVDEDEPAMAGTGEIFHEKILCNNCCPSNAIRKMYEIKVSCVSSKVPEWFCSCRQS